MNPLNDVLPPQIRRALYAIFFVGALIFGIWQASQGDWVEFTGGLLTALVNLLAASNTPAPELEAA